MLTSDKHVVGLGRRAKSRKKEMGQDELDHGELIALRDMVDRLHNGDFVGNSNMEAVLIWLLNFLF